MFSHRIRAGVGAGLISAAATAGAIIGFGIRHGDWSGSFVSLGTQVMQGFGVTDPSGFIRSAAGVAAHVGWMVLWGIAFVAMSNKRTTAFTAFVALLIGSGSSLIASYLIPAAMGAVRFAGLPSIQAALCVALMSVGLVTGRALASTD